VLGLEALMSGPKGFLLGPQSLMLGQELLMGSRELTQGPLNDEASLVHTQEGTREPGLLASMRVLQRDELLLVAQLA